MTINIALAKARNLSNETITAIQEIHIRLDHLLVRPSMYVESPRKAVEMVENLEYTLQLLWGFPLDKSFHTYWFELRDCTCPKMDNRERFGKGYRIITDNCPYHCTDRIAETWEDRRFGLNKENKCDCGKEGEPEHTCPYREDVHGDYTTVCNCCVDCQNECCADI